MQTTIFGTWRGRWRRTMLAVLAAMSLAVVALAAPVWAGAVRSNTTAVTIPTTTGAAAPYPSTISVTGLPARGITDLNVTLDGLSHTYPDDLDVLLVGPGGQKAMLMSDAGGSGDLNNVNLTFDGDPAPPPDGGQITCCRLSPSNYNGADDNFPAPAGPYATSLSVFDGANPNGEYRLFVYDGASSDGGQISGGWSLDITAPAPNDDFADAQAIDSAAATVNGDNFSGGSEPGEPKVTTGDAVWYRWTAPNTGQTVLDMCGSSVPMVAVPHTGDAVNAPTQVPGNAFSPCAAGGSYRATFNATAGQAYKIQALGINNA